MVRGTHRPDPVRQRKSDHPGVGGRESEGSLLLLHIPVSTEAAYGQGLAPQAQRSARERGDARPRPAHPRAGLQGPGKAGMVPRSNRQLFEIVGNEHVITRRKPIPA